MPHLQRIHFDIYVQQAVELVKVRFALVARYCKRLSWIRRGDSMSCCATCCSKRRTFVELLSVRVPLRHLKYILQDDAHLGPEVYSIDCAASVGTRRTLRRELMGRAISLFASLGS